MNSNLRLYYWISGSLISLSLVSIFLYPFIFGWSVSNQSSEWSNFGQYIGGTIGPIFSLLAFIGVLLTLAIQKEENEKKEIESKKNSAENRIIKQIELHHHICTNVRVASDIKRTKFKEGRLAFEFLYEKYFKTFYKEVDKQNPKLDEDQKVDYAFTRLYSQEGKQFGFYFRNLYYLIKYIDETEYIDKKHFTRLVRAQLSTPEIQMLMYNCLFKKGKGFWELTMKYDLLNGIDETEMIKPGHRELIKPLTNESATNAKND